MVSSRLILEYIEINLVAFTLLITCHNYGLLHLFFIRTVEEYDRKRDLIDSEKKKKREERNKKKKQRRHFNRHQRIRQSNDVEENSDSIES